MNCLNFTWSLKIIWKYISNLFLMKETDCNVTIQAIDSTLNEKEIFSGKLNDEFERSKIFSKKIELENIERFEQIQVSFDLKSGSQKTWSLDYIEIQNLITKENSVFEYQNSLCNNESVCIEKIQTAGKLIG